MDFDPAKCFLPDCSEKRYGRGLCRNHYASTGYYVQIGRTTWKQLEMEKKALPGRVKFTEEELRIKKKKAARIFYLENRDTFRDKARQYYLKNSESIKASVNKYRKYNLEKVRLRKLIHYRENRDVLVAKQKDRYYSDHERYKAVNAKTRKKNREKLRMQSRQRSESLSDVYVREQLSKCSPISSRQWPQELVDAKKAQIMLRRQLKLWPALKTLKNCEINCLTPTSG